MRKIWWASKGSTNEYWEDFFPNEKEIEKRIQDFLPNEIVPSIIKRIKRGNRVLDAGCGPMVWGPQIAGCGAKYTGLDLSLKLLDLGKKVFKDYEFETIVGSVLDLQQKDSSYDMYLSMGVLEHFEEGMEAPINECVRILKPGGYACISVPYLNIIRHVLLPFENFFPEKLKRWRFIRRILGKKQATNQKFYQYGYSLSDLRTIITSTGLVIEGVQPYEWEYGLTRDYRYIRKIGRIYPKQFKKLVDMCKAVSPFLCAHMILVIAKKPFEQ